MALLLNTGATEFTAQDLTSTKGEPGITVLSWTNSEGRDVRVQIQVQLGKTGGLLDDTSSTTFTFKPSIQIDSEQTFFPFQTIINHDTANNDNRLWVDLGEFFVPSGGILDLYILSDNVNDTDVDGDVYLVDTQAGIDVRAVGGATPATLDDVTTVKDILEGDEAIDTEATPWQLVIKKKSTEDELVRKDLKDISGSNISNINTVIGSMKEPD